MFDLGWQELLKDNLNKHTNLESYIKDSEIGVGVKKKSKVKLKK